MSERPAQPSVINLECRNITNHDPLIMQDCGGCPRCPDDDEHRCHLTGNHRECEPDPRPFVVVPKLE